MSISKFSKNVLIVTDGYQEYKELEVKQQKTALTVIDNIITRLVKLGFKNYYLLGDDSLSKEVKASMEKHYQDALNVKVARMYPETADKFLLENIIEKSRDQMYYESEPIEVTKAEQEILYSCEENLMLALNGTIDVTNVVPEDVKIYLIKHVIMLHYFLHEITHENIEKYKKQYPVFLATQGLNKEHFEKGIKVDLDRLWKWATTMLTSDNLSDSTIDGTKEESSITDNVDSEGLKKMLEKLSKQGNKAASKITIGIDMDKVKRDEQMRVSNKIEKENSGDKITQINLTEDLKELTKKDLMGNENLVEHINKVLEIIDTYTNTIYFHLINECNFIVDLYSSKTSPRSRKLPYKDTKKNKMILSVDIKTGEFDLYFRGNEFKINSLFEKGEPVTTNVLEW